MQELYLYDTWCVAENRTHVQTRPGPEPWGFIAENIQGPYHDKNKIIEFDKE